MKIRKTVFWILFLLAENVFSQQPEFKVFLVGDAGDKKVTGETLDSLKSQLLANPNSAVIFLGDNSYRNSLFGIFPWGFKGFDGSSNTRQKINSQLNILDNYKGAVYFIPGNHDWWNLTKFEKGKRKLKLEEDFIESRLRQNRNILNPDSTCFLPSNGSPGPASVELNDKKLRVVFIDSYWFILLGFKKTPVENNALEKLFYHNLDSILADASAKKQKIIVTAHHPIHALGSHTYKVKNPNFLRRIKTSTLNFPSYKKMIRQLDSLLIKYPGTYYASGHVHALQFYLRNGVHYIISGSGSKIHKKKHKKSDAAEPCTESECLIWNEQGFFEIVFSESTAKIIMTHCNGKKKCEIFKPDDCKGGCD